MKLISLTPFQTLPIPGVRTAIAIKPGEGAFAEWYAHVRGPSVFLISPQGWSPGRPAHGEARQVFEIPRSHCHIQWEFEKNDKLEDVVKHDPAPRPPKPKLPEPGAVDESLLTEVPESPAVEDADPAAKDEATPAPPTPAPRSPSSKAAAKA